MKGNEEQSSLIAEIQDENQQLRLITEEQNTQIQKLENQSKAFAAALEELESKILELTPCPCGSR